MLRILRLAILTTLSIALAAKAQDATQTPLRFLSDQPLPLTITNGSIQPFGDTSQILAEATAPKGSDISSAEFYLVQYHGDQVLGGEGWVESSPTFISHQTKLAFHNGDSAFLIVVSVKTPNRTFALSKSDLGTYIAHTIHGEIAEQPAVLISNVYSPNPTQSLRHK
ncbi:MAG: hypothetical protein PW792_12630 [Acidobacteriaceae bacterium]|nr:hypothetical protein [Acidobacteriaceae bacterium]